MESLIGGTLTDHRLGQTQCHVTSSCDRWPGRLCRWPSASGPHQHSIIGAHGDVARAQSVRRNGIDRREMPSPFASTGDSSHAAWTYPSVSFHPSTGRLAARQRRPTAGSLDTGSGNELVAGPDTGHARSQAGGLISAPAASGLFEHLADRSLPHRLPWLPAPARPDVHIIRRPGDHNPVAKPDDTAHGRDELTGK